MTLYWWTHWFWITSTAGVLLEILGMIATIETYPLSPPFINKEYSKKDKLLKFPLAAQLDVDDVFTAGGEPMNAAIRDKKVISNKPSGITKKSSISDTVVNKSVNDNITSQVSEEITNKSNVSLIANRTKGDDEPFPNNSLSTPLSVEQVTVTSSQNGTSDSIPEDSNRTSTSQHLDHSEIINCTHTNSVESAKESSVNQTATEFNSPNDKSDVLENPTNDDESTEAQNDRQLGERGRKSKVLTEYRNELKYINFSSDAKNLLARSAAVSLDLDEQDEGNVSSEALSIQRAYILNAGTISGICFGVLGVFCAATLVGITLYRRRYLNKPQTLSEPDSSAYIDDSTMRDNSDEMYSLDNDSFLNSLEAMTIQNYWTDTVKHTKL